MVSRSASRVCVLACVLVACGDDAGSLADAPLTDAALAPCPVPTGAGTQHMGELTADETWTAAGSPHIVTFDVVIRGGRTLTVEECAVVRVQGHYSITVGASLPSDGTGKLVAHGTSLATAFDQPGVMRPVLFTADDPGDWWGSLQVNATGQADLEVVILERAGHPDQFQGGGGALVMRGDDNRRTPIRNVRAAPLFIRNSATYGVNARASAGFTADSSGVVISDSGSRGAMSAGEDSRYAMYVEAPAIHTLPPASFSGNARSEIVAFAPFTVEVDERFLDRSVPYQLRNQFAMRPPTAGPAITLTIDPGVTLKLGGPLASNPSITLGDGGGGLNFPVRLVAAGTASTPITITSGAVPPAPGDWATIDWQGGPATGNVMSHVTVEYGGGESATNGFGCGPGDNDSLLLFTEWRPTEPFIQGSTFAHSAAGGIVSGWASDAAGPDFRTGNTFSAIADACQVSLPKNAAGMCPGNDATPDCY